VCVCVDMSIVSWSAQVRENNRYRQMRTFLFTLPSKYSKPAELSQLIHLTGFFVPGMGCSGKRPCAVGSARRVLTTSSFPLVLKAFPL